MYHYGAVLLDMGEKYSESIFIISLFCPKGKALNQSSGTIQYPFSAIFTKLSLNINDKSFLTQAYNLLFQKISVPTPRMLIMISLISLQ